MNDRDGIERGGDEPRVCRKLRQKGGWDTEAEGRSWKHGESTTAAYWCLSTMEAFGPDEAPCHPHQCAEGRSCYRPEDGHLPPSPPRLA